MEKIWGNNFLELYHLEKYKMGLCRATNEYIPIEEFKNGFTKASEFVKQYEWNGFVFDKSKLTTFHQPSMEWYYTEWKRELVQIGLSKHYKILPSLPWFKSSVEAGKEDIKKNNPSFDFTQFKVFYIDKLEDLPI